MVTDKAKVLVIDDDKWIQRVFFKYLSGWGFDVVTATDGFTGVAKAIKEKPDLVFLDVILPEIQGGSVLKMLKTIDETKEIPVIVTSANFDKEILKKTKSNAIAYVTKPINEDVLYNKIKESVKPMLLKKLEKSGFSAKSKVQDT